MRFKNVAPYALDVPSLWRVVEPGEVVEVEDATAAAGFVGQVGVWEPVDEVPAEVADIAFAHVKNDEAEAAARAALAPDEHAPDEVAVVVPKGNHGRGSRNTETVPGAENTEG